ncbi:MAG: hypothetical protein V4438_04385 [Patescibacteria group bacterium]
MTYELAKKLKDAGFPQKSGNYYVGDEVWDETAQSDYETRATPKRDNWIYAPTLSELIEACGPTFRKLKAPTSTTNQWIAAQFKAEENNEPAYAVGSTPEEAVANLWLVLNEK